MPTFGVSLTTVLTPAASTALTTVAAFKQELGLAGAKDDSFIAGLVAQASAAAARYCNRTFPVETVLDQVFPDLDPYPFQVPGGLARLQLARWPIVAVTSVVENAIALVEGTDFLVDPAAGQLIRLDPNGWPCVWSPLPLAITYSGGYDPIPADLVDAVLRMMRLRWFARARDPALRSESVAGVWDASYWFGAGPGSSGAMPPDIAGILDGYHVPVAG